jgi:hypothetical protein
MHRSIHGAAQLAEDIYLMVPAAAPTSTRWFVQTDLVRYSKPPY